MKATKLELKPWAWHGGEPERWTIVAHVDKLPQRLTNYTMFDTSVRELPRVKKTQFFFAEENGYVEYCVQTDDTHGYGGAVFNKFVKHAYVLQDDGSVVEEHISGERDPAIEYAQILVGWWVLKGPWSSRASVFNDLALEYPFLDWPLCLEVTYVTPDDDIRSGAATLGWVYEQIQRLARTSMEVVYSPTKPPFSEARWEVVPLGYIERQEEE